MFGCTRWTALLSLPQVANFLEADLGVSHSCKTKVCLFRRSVMPRKAVLSVVCATDEDLRWLWHALWGGQRTVEEFCSEFGCNTSHFRAWLNRKRLQDPASSGAVRQWLKRIYDGT